MDKNFQNRTAVAKYNFISVVIISQCVVAMKDIFLFVFISILVLVGIAERNLKI